MAVYNGYFTGLAPAGPPTTQGATSASVYDGFFAEIDGFVADLEPPFLIDQTPAPNATRVDLGANIVFTVQDTLSPVVRSTIQARVSRGPRVDDAIIDGVIVAPFNGVGASITSNGNGWDIVLDPTTDFTEGLVVTVTVSAQDLPGNLMLDASYTFYAGLAFNTAICLAGKDRLRNEYKELYRPLFNKLLCSYLSRLQPIRQALNDIRDYRSLDTATGVGLDNIGQLYDETRYGRSDAEYRKFLRALAKVSASKGTPNEMLDILVTLDDGAFPGLISITFFDPAYVIMTCRANSLSEGLEFARVLKRVVPSGVGFELNFTYVDDALLFAFSGFTGVGWVEDGPVVGADWATTSEG